MSSNSWLDLMNDAAAGGTSFEPLPDGDYDLKVLSAEAAVTSTGKPMYKVKAEVQSGPHARRLVWDNLVVSKDSPNALGFFFRKMDAIGLGRDFFAQAPSDAQIVQALQNRTFRAKVIIKTKPNGDKGNEIKEYHRGAAVAPGAFPPAPAPAVPAPAPAVAAPPVAAPAPAPTYPAAPAPAPAPSGASPWDQAPAPAPAAPGAVPQVPQAPF